MRPLFVATLILIVCHARDARRLFKRSIGPEGEAERMALNQIRNAAIYLKENFPDSSEADSIRTEIDNLLAKIDDIGSDQKSNPLSSLENVGVGDGAMGIPYGQLHKDAERMYCLSDPSVSGGAERCNPHININQKKVLNRPIVTVRNQVGHVPHAIGPCLARLLKNPKPQPPTIATSLKEVGVKFTTTNHYVRSTHVRETPAVIGNSVEPAPCEVKLHQPPEEPRIASPNYNDKDVEQTLVTDVVQQSAESRTTVEDVPQSRVEEDTKDRIGNFENRRPNVPQQRIPQKEQISPADENDRHPIPASESSASESYAMPSFRYKYVYTFMYLNMISMTLFKL
jgi:hypothetical protein